MPKKIQQKIRAALLKSPALHNGVYELRATINGVAICGRASTPDLCEERFLENLTSNLNEICGEKKNAYHSRMPFTEWAAYWFEEVYKHTVSQTTYEKILGRYHYHVEPFFKNETLNSITPLLCNKFIKGLLDKGIERTAEECYGLLSRILSFAAKNDFIRKNPMEAVPPVHHERQNGVPLSKEEEKAFLERIRGMKYEAVMVLALYTGLRPCEYGSAKIEGDFIVARNRKQKKTKKPVYKKIPITPMLRPYIPLIEENMPRWQELTVKDSKRVLWQFQECCPGHRLYDLRTTFATRTQECLVPENIVQIWMGHSSGSVLAKVYTKFSDEYLLKEGEKVKY